MKESSKREDKGSLGNVSELAFIETSIYWGLDAKLTIYRQNIGCSQFFLMSVAF